MPKIYPSNISDLPYCNRLSCNFHDSTSGKCSRSTCFYGKIKTIDDIHYCNPSVTTSKYNRVIRGETIDIYDILVAYGVTNPALQHLIKKALMAGQRGHKDRTTDMKEILEAAQRAIELEEINGT